MQTTIIKQESNQFIIELSPSVKDIKVRDVVRHCNNQFDFDVVGCGNSLKRVMYSVKTLEQGEDISLLETKEPEYWFYLYGFMCLISTKETKHKYMIESVTRDLNRDDSSFQNPEYTKSDYIVNNMRCYMYDKQDCYNNKYVITGINGLLEGRDYSDCGSKPTFNDVLDKRIFLILDFGKLC